MNINLGNTFKAIVFFFVGIFAAYILAKMLDKLFDVLTAGGLYDMTTLEPMIWTGYVIFTVLASAVYPIMLLFEEEEPDG